ncbi:MAG: hypothetical protein K0S88_119 [Actinomycetia bacterium]|jgi:hypothetical protein|nr:hypothetical protein [Actinomycetes bacterium]
MTTSSSTPRWETLVPMTYAMADSAGKWPSRLEPWA